MKKPDNEEKGTLIKYGNYKEPFHRGALILGMIIYLGIKLG
jgi:hypothetical protein